MRALLVILLLLLLGLQYRLWVGEGGVAEQAQLQERIDVQAEENSALKENNDGLYVEIDELKNGEEAIEEHARTELGLVQEGETYYLIIDEEQESLEQ